MESIIASVIIPVYEKERTIRKCIDSVLNQTLLNQIEMIIIDDCSQDDSWKIIQEYSSKTILTLRNNENQGAGYCRNKGIQKARGEYVFFLDADGVTHPQWVEEGIKFFLEYKNCVGVEGENYKHSISNSLKERNLVNPFYFREQDVLLDHIHRDYPAGNIAYRKSVLIHLSGFKEARYRNGREDTDLGIRALAHGIILKNPQMLVTFEKERWSFFTLLKNSQRYYYDVVFCVDHGFFKFKNGRVLHPRFLYLLLNPFRMRKEFYGFTFKDLIYFYIYLIALRLSIWYASFKERVFII